MPPDRRLVTNAVLAWLKGAQPRQVGDGEVPTPTVVPYAVLYGLPGGRYTGPPYAAPEANAALPYQATAVGRLREEAEDMAALIAGVVCGREVGGAFTTPPPVIAGLAVMDRRLDGAYAATREGALWNAHVLFSIEVTPA